MIKFNEYVEENGWGCYYYLGHLIDCDDPVYTFSMNYIFNILQESDKIKRIDIL